MTFWPWAWGMELVWCVSFEYAPSHVRWKLTHSGLQVTICVTPTHIIAANAGDSRAVLGVNGMVSATSPCRSPVASASDCLRRRFPNIKRQGISRDVLKGLLMGGAVDRADAGPQAWAAGRATTHRRCVRANVHACMRKPVESVHTATSPRCNRSSSSISSPSSSNAADIAHLAWAVRPWRIRH